MHNKRVSLDHHLMPTIMYFHLQDILNVSGSTAGV